LSASPEIAVQSAMKRFGIPGRVIALRHKMDGEILSHELDAPHSIAEGKVDCIKTLIHSGRRPLLGIGDSVHDLPMIAYAELSAVVDRDKAVTEEACRPGWFILQVTPYYGLTRCAHANNRYGLPYALRLHRHSKHPMKQPQ
jgi:phosphoserine phosphatase